MAPTEARCGDGVPRAAKFRAKIRGDRGLSRLLVGGREEIFIRFVRWCFRKLSLAFVLLILFRKRQRLGFEHELRKRVHFRNTKTPFLIFNLCIVALKMSYQAI